jgi:hypothetical protein
MKNTLALSAAAMALTLAPVAANAGLIGSPADLACWSSDSMADAPSATAGKSMAF